MDDFIYLLFRVGIKIKMLFGQILGQETPTHTLMVPLETEAFPIVPVTTGAPALCQPTIWS